MRNSMQVRSISEADPLQRREIDFPSYRVHFYDRFGTGASGGTSICFLLTDVHNVHQVYAWAEASARGRTYCVYAVYDPRDGEAVWLQLSGDDPNSPDDPHRVPPPELAAADEVAIAEREDYEHKYHPERRRHRNES